jgi:hypothetical protein
VTIPKGKTSATFTVKTNRASPKDTVTISATVGATTKSANLSIK